MKKMILGLVLNLICSISLGHGESKPGPNGGFIRMPGAFHTELVLEKNQTFFDVYLLDMEFKNPRVKNSAVTAVLEQKRNKKVSFVCHEVDGHHYRCKSGDQSPIDFTKDLGQLSLNVKRDGVEGKALYELPLKWTEKSPPVMDHSAHH
jgi:hypothetical protein